MPIPPESDQSRWFAEEVQIFRVAIPRDVRSAELAAILEDPSGSLHAKIARKSLAGKRLRSARDPGALLPRILDSEPKFLNREIGARGNRIGARVISVQSRAQGYRQLKPPVRNPASGASSATFFSPPRT